MSREEIEGNQLELLRALVTEIFPGNRFYSRKLNALGLTFDVAGLADFRERFPFTTKSELLADQEQHPPFGTNLTYPLQTYTRFHQTSGTSGKPLRWLDTPESWDGMIESWMRIFRAAGTKSGDRVFFAFSFGPFIGFWLAFESAERLGCLCLPGGGLTSTARVQAILDNEATTLCCTPTYALRLAEAAQASALDLTKSKVRTLIVAGEPGGSVDSVRKRISALWGGARVFDHHGMTETGPVTYECPVRPGVLHVLESAYLPEVIDPATERQVNTGGTGELVLTTLNRLGMPLLRYRTGDSVKLASGTDSIALGLCPCGSCEMALQGGILGRTDNMIVIKGVNVFPSAVDEIIRSCDGIEEYQVEIIRKGALPELKVTIEPRDNAGADSIVIQLQKRFEIALALRVPISIAPKGTLPRFEMKAKRWRQ